MSRYCVRRVTIYHKPTSFSALFGMCLRSLEIDKLPLSQDGESERIATVRSSVMPDTQFRAASQYRFRICL